MTEDSRHRFVALDRIEEAIANQERQIELLRRRLDHLEALSLNIVTLLKELRDAAVS